MRLRPCSSTVEAWERHAACCLGVSLLCGTTVAATSSKLGCFPRPSNFGHFSNCSDGGGISKQHPECNPGYCLGNDQIKNSIYSQRKFSSETSDIRTTSQ